MTTIAETIEDIKREIDNLEVKNTANIRKIRSSFSRRLKSMDPTFMLTLGLALRDDPQLRWVGYELIRYHQDTFAALDKTALEQLGQGMSSWHDVDEFGRILSGPAWVRGQISDALIHKWAQSADLWRRRAALVSTIASNMRSHGATGDIPRTLTVCRMLAGDPEDMVVKAMSWALRELIPHDPQAVEDFLETHEDQLAARVKREVRNKLTTGLKTPKKKA